MSRITIFFEVTKSVKDHDKDKNQITKKGPRQTFARLPKASRTMTETFEVSWHIGTADGIPIPNYDMKIKGTICSVKESVCRKVDCPHLTECH